MCFFFGFLGFRGVIGFLGFLCVPFHDRGRGMAADEILGNPWGSGLVVSAGIARLYHVQKSA